MDKLIVPLNIELWTLTFMISSIKKWFAGKGHVGTHGPCVRFNALVYLPSIPLNKWSVTHKPHRGFVVYRAVLVCNANAVMGRVMRKQRHRCCFRTHSTDRVASLRSATLLCKQRNRDAVCPSNLSYLPLLIIAWVENNNKNFPINYPLCLPSSLRGRTSRASLHAPCLQIIF